MKPTVRMMGCALLAVAGGAQAQFQLPPSVPTIGAPPRPFVQQLTYQYAYGSESDMIYRRNLDLNNRLRDNFLIAQPQINGIIVYRPTPWLEGTLELILEKEVPIDEERRVTLPSGEVVEARKRRVTLPVDQAFVAIRNITAPFDLSLGRKNYEDERHWLFDSSIDQASVGFRQGTFRAEAVAGRETRFDLDLAPRSRQARDRVDTFMLYGEYRGIEDTRLAAYSITRHDRSRNEGRPRLMGVRVLGNPSDGFNYWGDVATTRGKDELARKFSGHGFDAGLTYRFTRLPLQPSFTLAAAFGSGDSNRTDPADRRSAEFRQSGLHTNEGRFSGVSKFKYYGEVLDPELSNLKILTLGAGFRPAPNIYVDLVYHKYRQHKLSEELRNSPLTAELNQVEGRFSRDIGQAFDVVVGLRRLFGLPRLGVDVRAGYFKPGKAFTRNDGTDEEPLIRGADKGVSVLFKFWW
jgi:alginate production protein